MRSLEKRYRLRKSNVRFCECLCLRVVRGVCPLPKLRKLRRERRERARTRNKVAALGARFPMPYEPDLIDPFEPREYGPPIVYKVGDLVKIDGLKAKPYASAIFEKSTYIRLVWSAAGCLL